MGVTRSIRVVIGVISIAQIHPMHIVNEPVVIVVYAVARNLICIGPHIRKKILVSPISAGVRYGDNHGRVAVFSLDNVPGFGQTHMPEIRLVTE